MTQKHLSARAWAELLLLSLIWGGSFFAIRVALDEVGPLTSVLHRTFWAMLVLWAAVLLGGHALPRGLRVWAAFAVMGLLNNVLPFSLMAWAQLTIESGLTAILNAATAIFGVLVAALAFADERLTARRAAGVAIGFAGVVVTVGPERALAFDPRSAAQLAVLAGALCYALAGAFARRQLSHLAPQVAAAGMLSASTLWMLPLVLVFEGAPALDLAPQTWAAIGYYAVIATAFAYLLYYRVLAMAGSGNLMLVTLLITPTAIALGAIGLGEELPPRAYAGFALLAAGLLVLDGRLLRRRAAPRAEARPPGPAASG